MEYTGDKSWRNPPAPIPEDQISETYTYDVVVAGLGHAGTAAARAAAESGASVVAVDIMQEKAYRAWGMDVGHINSAFLASRGVPKVDPIDLFNEMMRRNQNQANPELVMKYCQNCGTTFDWYMELIPEERQKDMFVRFWPAFKHFDGELSGFHFWQGTAVFPGMRGEEYPSVLNGKQVLMDPEDLEFMKNAYGTISLTEASRLQHQRIRDCGGVLEFGVSAEQLIQDESGRVTALIGKKLGQYIRYNARKGVIIALGGIGGNQQMCQDLLGNISDLFVDENNKFISSGRKGRGMQLGVWAGGKIEPQPLPMMGGDYITHNGLLHTFGSLWINDQGDRFCNELFGDPCIVGKIGPMIDMEKYYIVFDSNIMEHVEYGPPAHTAFEHDKDAKLLRLMRESVEAGDAGVTLNNRNQNHLYAGQTIEELAARLKLTAEAEKRFVESFYRYNQHCRNGRDDDFGRDPKVLLELNQPPFFAEEAPARAGIGRSLCCVGGLVTDGDQNVLDTRLKQIPGLFATGNSCGRRFGPQYNTPIAGVSIGMALTLGRELGLYVANL